LLKLTLPKRAVHDKCGYTEYQDKYLQFPPPSVSFPVLSGPTRRNNYSCDQFDNAYAAILEINPCFNIYHISEVCLSRRECGQKRMRPSHH